MSSAKSQILELRRKLDDLQGEADRLDRIRALGNAQVPLQAAAAWTILTGGK